MTPTQDQVIDRLARFGATVLENPWIPVDHRRPPADHPDRQAPTTKQAEFLMLDAFEAMFGGAAGGGKSDALLMAALQYVEVPGYSAGLFRKSYSDLSRPNALMDRARRWLAGTAAKWNEQSHTFTFPSGATLMFGYLDAPGDEYRYQGAEFQFIGVDELTQIREDQYRYLFSRVRRLESAVVPLRVRAATNPGGVGHQWVKRRFFVEGPQAGRVFVPARLTDNPHIDQSAYLRALAELDPVKRAQLEAGDWDIEDGGGKLRKEWFTVIPRSRVPSGLRWVRYWDLAATSDTDQRTGRKKDPDWTAGALMGTGDGRYYLADMARTRAEPPGVEALVKQTAAVDRQQCGHMPTWMEQEPGSSGKTVISVYARKVLPGYEFYGDRVSGSKISRAGPFISAASRGDVFVVEAPWVRAFLDEVELFPLEGHDDQVDAVSGAFSKLAEGYDGQVDAVDAGFFM